METEELLGFDKNDYEAGGTGWSVHGSGCDGCGLCAGKLIQGKPAMIPEDEAGKVKRESCFRRPYPWIWPERS